MERLPFSTYSKILWLLLILFCIRVVAQIVVYFVDVPFLPSFAHWHSDSIPYSALVISQLIIIFVMSHVALKFSRGQVVANRRIGSGLIVIGGLYCLLMAIRLITGLAGLSEHDWWDKPIPAVFHLVLALFIIVTGRFHYRFSRIKK